MILLVTSLVLWGSLMGCRADNSTAEKFCYEGPCGPSHWAEYDEQCAGKSQSPIDIPFSDLVDAAKLEIRLSKGCSTRRNFAMKNTGLHLEFVPVDNECACTVSGKHLEGKLCFSRADLHWGSRNTPQNGSPHKFNGKKFPVEVHLRFISKGRSDGPGSTVIFAFLFELGPKNAALKSVFSALENVRKPRTETQVSGLVLSNFFKFNSRRECNSVIVYDGSHTFPPCTENVKWHIFEEFLFLSSDQLEELQLLQDQTGQEIGGKSRPVQPRNGRMITRHCTSVKTEEKGGLLPGIFPFGG